MNIKRGKTGRRHIVSIPVILLTLGVSGCQQPGADLQSNVYNASQVNTRQEAEVVNILAVMPAKVEVSNAQAKKGAEVFGALLGALAGGIAGHNIGNRSSTNVALGAAGGAAAGGLAGSLVPGKVLVAGVSITYKDHGQIFNSAQVGKLCQFTDGRAIMISSSPVETRIQPNATCPIQATK